MTVEVHPRRALAERSAERGEMQVIVALSSTPLIGTPRRRRPVEAAHDAG